MIDWMIGLLAGTVAGFLAGLGVGGGTLLLVFLTLVLHMEQTMAQGINLLFFLPSAAFALPAHIKKGYVRKELLLPAILCGLLAAGGGVWLAHWLDTAVLRKLWGGLLLFAGGLLLFNYPKDS